MGAATYLNAVLNPTVQQDIDLKAIDETVYGKDPARVLAALN
jgi:hypothetical protein